MAANKEKNVKDKFAINNFAPVPGNAIKINNMMGKSFANKIEKGVDDSNKAEML